jgi:hypothetical protein
MKKELTLKERWQLEKILKKMSEEVLGRIRKEIRVYQWMPRHLTVKKDVVSCEKPWGATKQAMIHGYLNGETR